MNMPHSATARELLLQLLYDRERLEAHYVYHGGVSTQAALKYVNEKIERTRKSLEDFECEGA